LVENLRESPRDLPGRYGEAFSLMLKEEEKIEIIILQAVDDFNALFPADHQIGKTHNSVLYGENGVLDSMGLVSIVTDVEQRIEAELGVSLSIVNEDSLTLEECPFRKIGTFIEYVKGLLSKSS
jgi:acyl carrier protein